MSGRTLKHQQVLKQQQLGGGGAVKCQVGTASLTWHVSNDVIGAFVLGDGQFHLPFRLYTS